MPSTNGHGPKRAILYARVSGEEQAKKGYSLADQLDALRHWCSENDYEVIDEVQDRGFSGAYLERPGLDRIREMVAGGNVNAVVVLFRDRIARGVYAQEGVPSPGGKRFWNRPGLRKLIMSDVYLAHTYKEVAQIVSPEVASRLDPEKRYGISWYGRRRHTHTQEVRIKDGKKTDRKIKKTVATPREDWIGVPVPDSGIPREWVLAAREAIKDNEKVSNCGRRFWELTGGVLRCATCGYAMGTNFVTDRGIGYYRCNRRYRLGLNACSQSKTLRAVETEGLVWEFVSDLLKDPTRLKQGLDELVRQEKALFARGHGEDDKTWLKKLGELGTQEERLLDLYLENKLDTDRYDRRLAQIKQARKAVEDELARIEGRAARLDRLERDKETLLSHYARIVPEHLDSLEPAERNHVYKVLKLTVLAHQNGSLELSWAHGADLCRDNEPLPPGSCRTPGR